MPLTIPIPPAFARLDDAVDSWFDSYLRGNPLADAVMYSASAVGDHGILWLAFAGLQAARRRGGNWQRPLLRAVSGLAVESAVVNGPVKWMFRRTRPMHDEPRPWNVRQPRTSSFPSGHATSAFLGAALLSDDDPYWPIYYALAAVVAASRVHVKVHHASDVLGGVIIGAAMGQLVRKLFPLTKESPAAELR
ncbi:MAG TPA: phosphatase PAP2 family protein [Acidimicrobiales bacterium]